MEAPQPLRDVPENVKLLIRVDRLCPFGPDVDRALLDPLATPEQVVDAAIIAEFHLDVQVVVLDPRRGVPHDVLACARKPAGDLMCNNLPKHVVELA